MENNETINTDECIALAPFLRNLADSLENKTLLPQQIHKIGEFFMSYYFQKELHSDEEMSNEFSREDLLKFLSLGYYIYIHILNEKSLD
jgi:hypothetical protein